MWIDQSAGARLSVVERGGPISSFGRWWPEAERVALALAEGTEVSQRAELPRREVGEFSNCEEVWGPAAGGFISTNERT